MLGEKDVGSKENTKKNKDKQQYGVNQRERRSGNKGDIYNTDDVLWNCTTETYTILLAMSHQ